jgi:hypothetical protein
MDGVTSLAQVYVCPMHSAVRQLARGKCPTCGMELIAEGTRFALLRHMFGNPRHLAIMLILMLIAMAAVMMR